MAEGIQPLSDEERAELEALRAEKAAREERERIAAERAELESLRADRQQASHAATAPAPSRRPVSSEAAAREAQEDQRIREARERGAKLMEPDDDLRMPVGQKIVLAVLALLVIIVLVMTKLVG